MRAPVLEVSLISSEILLFLLSYFISPFPSFLCSFWFFLARSQNYEINVFFAEILSHDFFWRVCFLSFCHPLLSSSSISEEKTIVPLNIKTSAACDNKSEKNTF